MTTPADPPGFVIRTEAQKAAFDNGFRLERGVARGWLRYGSTTARGEISIAGVSMHGPWLLSIGDPGVAAEFGPAAASPVTGPGCVTVVFATLTGLHAGIDRVYRLGVSLPDVPLREFQARTGPLPRTTEAQREVIQRVGQDVFRAALLKYWNRRCPLTGITDPALLRASHIVPWAECETDALRLDVHNGLLLSSLWDAAFDAGLVGFADDGVPLFSSALSREAKAFLTTGAGPILTGLSDAHRINFARHRMKHGL